ncbi:MAG: DUF438 domain-containing protein, partial [Halanaerobiales bacterium]
MTVEDKKKELRDVLERLNSGENTEQVKKEARELLETIDARELSEAEQMLIDEGLEEKELRHLCTAHLEAVAEELEALKEDVGPGHPLYTFIREHEIFLQLLDRLEEVKDKLLELNSYQEKPELISELQELGEKLLETEKHHEREEEALFPGVDKTGVTGPTRIMRMEHEDLWPQKKKLHALAEGAGELDFEMFKNELEETVEYIVLTMRDHIFKE